MTSGRKRPSHPVISLGEVRSQRTYEQLLSQLEAFCENLPDNEPWSIDQFFGGEPSDQEMEVLQYAFLDWLAFDYRAWEDGRTVPERLAEGGKIDDAARDMLHLWQGTRPGLYQTVTCLGSGLLLRDCFTGKEFPIQVDEGVEPMSPDDLVICRILPVGDGFHLAYDVRTTSARGLPMVREAVERELLRMRRQDPEATWDNLFKDRWPLVHDAIAGALAAGSAMPLPQWRTPPSAGRVPGNAGKLQHEVARVLWEFLTADDVSFLDRQRAMCLWWDAAAALNMTTGRVEAWAAGAAYAHLHYALSDLTTQADLSEAFGISVSSLAARARAIVEALGLEELDDRYADPLDPRVRFRSLPESLAVRAVAASAVPSGGEIMLSDEVAAQRLLSLQQDEDVTVLTLLGQSCLAGGSKKEARAYAERAKAAQLSCEADRREGLLRLVELLADLGDDEGILAVTAGANPADLEGPVLRRAAVAASRAGRPADAMEWLGLAQDKGEPLNLVGPFIDALRLMSMKRVPVFKLDYEEKLDSLLGWLPKLNALTRAHLVCGIYQSKAKDAVQAVRALGAQRDPWAGRLLKHLYRMSDLPRTVQDAVEKALKRWDR
ncbi:MAG TPA: hypothetical protein VD969_11095 [Symbiobacteriaceae bacterium]|nr:hypothetical protein [Symbiobacteriaceae bacterium]